MKKSKAIILEWDGTEPDSIRNSIPAWRPGTMFSIPSSIIDPILPPAHRKNKNFKFVVTEIIPHPEKTEEYQIKATILDTQKIPTKESIEFNYSSGLSVAASYHGNISM